MDPWVSRTSQATSSKRDTLPQECRACPVRFACHGECPKNRFLGAGDGTPGRNYLCAGYKAFFTHIDEPMRVMTAELRANHAPSNVMAYMAGRRRSRTRRYSPGDPSACRKPAVAGHRSRQVRIAG